jgi:hypothetical protein
MDYKLIPGAACDRHNMVEDDASKSQHSVQNSPFAHHGTLGDTGPVFVHGRPGFSK